MKKLFGYLLYLGIVTTVLLLGLEAALRLFGLPIGLYNFRPLDQSMIYLPDETIQNVSGPLPYEIRTNRFGYRGNDFTLEKPAGTTRIVALGDSVTEGFYVDNPDTYPAQLEAILRARGNEVEVINVSQGFSSIDKELALFRRWGLPLKPDAVVLTFVSNDITELRGKSKEEVLNSGYFDRRTSASSEWFLFGRTAIGEVLLDTMMRWRLRTYAVNRDALTTGERPQIMPGGANFDENVDVFLNELAIPTRGVPAYTELPPEINALIEIYSEGLDELNALCQLHGVTLVVSHHPDYSELYRPERPAPMRARLREICASRGILFHDLTPAFLGHDEEVLHFAPVDFHPNVAGNAAIAQSIADFLAANALLNRDENKLGQNGLDP